MTGREGDNSRESLLYFEGPLEVQGLFEYLFNERRKLCGEDCDVPLLMAPVPFPAACLKQLHLKVLRSASQLFLLLLFVVACCAWPHCSEVCTSSGCTLRVGVEAEILVACISDVVSCSKTIKAVKHLLPTCSSQQTWREAADCTLAWA